jgi:hypothetical protein
MLSPPVIWCETSAYVTAISAAPHMRNMPP